MIGANIIFGLFVGLLNEMRMRRSRIDSDNLKIDERY